jgi:F-type H+-transporting ATPase subunit a
MPSATFGFPIFLAEVSIKAEPYPGFFQWFTNSFFVAGIVTALIVVFVRRSMMNATLVPSVGQNLCEMAVDFLYGQVEGVLGPKVTPKAFPLLATLFIFILVSNWLGLVPGVGTIGWDSHHASYLTAMHIETPLLRPATADLNMTLGMAACAFLVWGWITVVELGEHETHGKGGWVFRIIFGIWGFIKHTFGPKGGLTGIMGLVMAVIFFFVGIIEVISILFRPVSLSLRLFGNVFAGENLLHAMAHMGDSLGFGRTASFFMEVGLQIPFYFLEILVGLIQAIVFALLCTVYIKLSMPSDDH